MGNRGFSIEHRGDRAVRKNITRLIIEGLILGLLRIVSRMVY
ncbi:hypothetical protein FDUTEX481_09742 [Tolypothrix sp. PCC 7601]|nr:hypothetical protein FDUTEX481_09742 [Tolypothrix sp. PCC 7601]